MKKSLIIIGTLALATIASPIAHGVDSQSYPGAWCYRQNGTIPGASKREHCVGPVQRFTVDTPEGLAPEITEALASTSGETRYRAEMCQGLPTWAEQRACLVRK
jgi:hypothetical protein